MRTRRLIPIVAFLAVLSTDACALSISGWGFKVGSIDGSVEIKGAGNKDALFLATLILTDTEYFCENPTSKLVAPGVAGVKTVNYEEPLLAPVRIEDNGKVYVDFMIYLDEEFTYDELKSGCNNLWEPLPETIAVKAFAVTLQAEYCTDASCTAFTGKGDTIKASCFLTQELKRDEYYVPVPGQSYACIETTNTN